MNIGITGTRTRLTATLPTALVSHPVIKQIAEKFPIVTV